MHLSIVRTADEDSPPEKQQNNITAGNRRFSIRESRRRDCVRRLTPAGPYGEVPEAAADPRPRR